MTFDEDQLNTIHGALLLARDKYRDSVALLREKPEYQNVVERAEQRLADVETLLAEHFA